MLIRILENLIPTKAPFNLDPNVLFSSVKKFFPRAPRDTEFYHNKIARPIARLI
jgi:hypothetical protein